jgi:hypothetical protein
MIVPDGTLILGPGGSQVPVDPSPVEEKKELSLEQRLADTQAKLHELAGENAALRKMLNDMALSRQRTPSTTPTETDDEEGGSEDFSWSSYLKKLGKAEKKTEEDSPRFSLDEVQKLTRMEIQQAVQAVTNHQQQAAAIWQDFTTNQQHLVPYAGLAARLFQATDPRKPMIERYREVLQEMNSMMEQGVLPRVQPKEVSSSLHGDLPMYLRGGQGATFNVRDVETGRDLAMEYGEEYLARVLAQETQERKERLQARKDAGR